MDAPSFGIGTAGANDTIVTNEGRFNYLNTIYGLKDSAKDWIFSFRKMEKEALPTRTPSRIADERQAEEK